MGKDYRKFVTYKAPSPYEAGSVFDAEGHFTSTRFHNQDTGFVIGTFHPKSGDEVICKGEVPGFVLGAPYHITGKVIDDPNWGIQVNIKTCAAATPSTKDEIIAFLGSGAIPGIGPVTAKSIYKTFGEDTLDVLERTPERLIEVTGIGAKNIDKMVKTLPVMLKYHEVIGYFAQFGISNRTINRLIEEYGSRTKEVIQKNPYVLCKIRGFAFSRADSIAMKMGVSRDNPNRLYAGVLSVLRWACESRGHTLMPVDNLMALSMEKLETENLALVRAAFDRLVDDEILIVDEDGAHLRYLFYAEKNIKRSLKAAVQDDELLEPGTVDAVAEVISKRTGMTLTDEQMNAVRNAYSKKVSIMTGGAGVGKAQPLYSKVLTSEGWKEMGELSVGDFVFTRKGTLAPIVAIHPQGFKHAYRVHLVDGRSADCCDEHLWTTVAPEGGFETHTLREMMGAGIEAFRLPANMPVRFEERELPRDSYEVGRSIGSTFAFEDAELISEEYLTASFDQRMDLLDGMLGAAKESGQYPEVEVTIAREQLKDQFVDVVRSLGFTASCSGASPWTVALSKGDSVPIASVEDLGCEVEMQCIEVADSEHLYLTDGYMVTHNTASCRMVVEIAKDLDIPVCLISPTGRAAKHLSEVCGIPGYTVHRALSILVKEETTDDFFSENETRTSEMNNTRTEAVKRFKEAQIVIADEASMMDTEMAAIVFKACRKKHLMLVGDPNQLPSVGPGRVLGDLLESSYADSIVTRLTKIFRQKDGSPVIDAANAVLEGNNPCYTPGVTFLECDNAHVPEQLENVVVPEIYARKLGNTDVMVLSPMKKTPHSGVFALNELLRPKLNPRYRKPSNPKQDFLLQAGDYVMQVKNNYEVDIYNGDIGIVDYVDEDGNVGVVFSDSEDIIEYSGENNEAGDNVILAFAMSVHKSQGSAADTVVVVLSNAHYAMLNRNLLYTAITRSSNKLILVGEKKAFAMAACNAQESNRMTGLRGI